MNHQDLTDDTYGNESRRHPHHEQLYMNPSHGTQPMQQHPQTVPFGSIPPNSLPQSAGDPSMFAWGPPHPPYQMHHGMQQGHPQYQYPPHPSQHVHQQYIAPTGHYAAPPGIPHGQPPFGQQPPYAAHQGQMYAYPYHPPGPAMNHHNMQPEHVQTESNRTGQSQDQTIGSPVRQEVDHGDLGNEEHTSPRKTNQSSLDSENDNLANEELFQYALKLLRPKVEKQVNSSKPAGDTDADTIPKVSVSHSFFATRAQSPDLLSYKITPLSSHTIGAHHDQVYARHTPSCSCRRPISRREDSTPEKAQVCLKLYCECFAYGAMCTDRCACSSTCGNNAKHSGERAHAVTSIMQEDPNGFRREMDWMTDLQKTARSDHVLAKERKGEVPVSKMDHDDITDDSLRIAKLPPNRYSMDLKGDNGVVYRALAFSMTHPKLHRRRKKGKAPISSGPAYKERVGYPTLALVANLECGKVKGMLQKVVTRVEKAGDEVSETNNDQKTYSHLTPMDKILSEYVVEELAVAQNSACSANNFVSSTYFEGSRLKRNAVEALGFSSDKPESEKDMDSDDDGLRSLEHLPESTVQIPLDPSKMKELILSISEDTAVIQHTASAIKSIARKLANHRVR